jgi:hypothetical protein
MLPGFSTASGAEAAAAAAAVAAAMLPDSPSTSSGHLADLTSLFLVDTSPALMMPDSATLLDLDLSGSDSEWHSYSANNNNSSVLPGGLLHSMHPATVSLPVHPLHHHHPGRSSQARSAANGLNSRSSGSSTTTNRATGRSKGSGNTQRGPRRWGQGQLHPQQAQVDALITEQLLRSTQCAAAGDDVGHSLLIPTQPQMLAPGRHQPASSGSDREEGSQLGRVAAAAAAAAVGALPGCMTSDDKSSGHPHSCGSRGNKRTSDDGTAGSICSDATNPSRCLLGSCHVSVLQQWHTDMQ